MRVIALVLGALLVVSSAEASYVEARATGVDVHADVGRDGRASVTYVLNYRVLGGALRSFAISGFEDDWRFHPTAKVTSSDERVLGAAVARDDTGVVHVTVDDPKGLKRGDYRFELLYEGALGARVTRDGAFDRVRFALPPLREGIDGVRVVLDLPPATTEPRAMTASDMAADLPTLRRSPDHDELELVRPHVPKGEAAIFLVRVDPKVLPHIDAAPPALPHAEAGDDRPRVPVGVAILVSACVLVVLALGLAKDRVLGARGLLPGPAPVRAALAAFVFGAGVLAEVHGRFTLGAGLVAAALPLLASRIPARESRPRARATWLVMKPQDVFVPARARADLLDGTTAVGSMVLGAALVLVFVACWFARTRGSAAPYFVAIDALVLVPIFFTGTSRQMPPDAKREALALAPVMSALAQYEELRVSPLARVLADGSIDETRLLVSLRLAMVGVSAVEVGVAWERAGGAMLPSFDVLARVQEASFAAAKMTARFPTVRALPGRKPEERVYRFEPDWPSTSAAAALVLDLADVVRDRRVVIAQCFEGPDRRAPAKRAATKGASLA